MSSQTAKTGSRFAVFLLLVAVVGATACGWTARWLGASDAAAVALAVLLCAAILWISEAIPLFVTSFVIALLNMTWLHATLARDDSSPGADAFLAPFFSNTVLLFLGGFVLSAALHKFLIDERLARWVLQRVGSSPARVLYGVMGVTVFLSMWMSNTATTAMMLAIALALLRSVPEDEPYRRALLLGIPFSANLGGLGTPIGTPPNAIAIQAMQDAHIDAPSFAGWIFLAAPLLLVLLAALGWILLRFYPPGIERVSMPEGQAFTWSRRSRGVVVVGLLTALGWLTNDIHGLSTGAIALIPVLVFFGIGVLNVDDFRRLPWDVLFIVGGGLSLGVAVSASGLDQLFVTWLPDNPGSYWVLLVIFIVLAAIMTSVMSNTATANLLVPVAISLSDVDRAPLLLGIAYACSLSMCLPVSTPPNAMVFSSGAISVRDLVRPGLVMSLLGVGLTATLGVAWWGLWM